MYCCIMNFSWNVSLVVVLFRMIVCTDVCERNKNSAIFRRALKGTWLETLTKVTSCLRILRYLPTKAVSLRQPDILGKLRSLTCHISWTGWAILTPLPQFASISRIILYRSAFRKQSVENRIHAFSDRMRFALFAGDALSVREFWNRFEQQHGAWLRTQWR